MISENKHYESLVHDCFLILRYLYQQNQWYRDEADKKFEDDCYNSPEFDYLYT